MSNKYIDKINALLAKAAATDFPDEAEAFMAKAQELMTLHAISEAMLSEAKHGEIVVRDIDFSGAYFVPRMVLLNTICDNNDVKAVRIEKRLCRIIGFETDVKNVQLLYTALAAHAVGEMTKTPVPAHESAKTFRHAFLISFANRIGGRLQEARRQATQEYEQQTNTSTAVVLADRATLVDQEVEKLFPRLSKSVVRSRQSSGHAAGRAAADSANIGQKNVPGGMKALGQ